MRYLARQPILDLRGRVHGYELLSRNGPATQFCGDGQLATQTMIDNTVLFGYSQLTGGLPAFVNCTAEILTHELVDVLPPSMTVLEILEDVEPLPNLIAACIKLKGQGYRLALDDFVWKPSLEPLVRVADYIKIDFIKSDQRDRREMLTRMRDHPVALLAEKVETQSQFQQACAEGFTLFQGYYFCRPVLLTNRTVPPNRMFHLQLLQLLHEEPLNLQKVADLVKSDAALTYRLLRLVNSPACAVRREVRSIKAALMVVGDDLFRRVATLAIASELRTGKSNEILRMAFVRARFCELTSELGAFDPLEQYLLGIFSLLPAMLQAPMSEIISALPLSQPLREALLGSPSDIRCPLEWMEWHEQGDWERCDSLAHAHALDVDQLHNFFTEAVMWADKILPASS